MNRVLMLKNRKNELIAMSKILNENLCPKNFLPLVEIIKEKKEYDKKLDPETGEYITIPKKSSTGKIRHYKIDDPDTERDVTLQTISELFKDRKVFVEYFRCNLNLYKGYDPKKNRLVVELNLNLAKYRERILQIVQYQNLVPVIAVKNGIDKFSPEEIVMLIDEIRIARHDKSIAVRIDDLDGYEESLKQSLTSRDYLLFDVLEQPIGSKEMEYEELSDLGIAAQLILLCSPRKRDLKIKDFETSGYTCQIDNFGIDKFRDYGFVGYGDYGGLSDELPTKSFGNPNHPGRALALLYNGKKRAFKSYVCDDVTLGQVGYRQLFDPIFLDRNDLDPNRNCIVYKELEDKIARGSNCTYQDWKQYTLMRYIQQISAE